ncbi:MAG: DUF1801 domain-containing protein [Anaerolineae bacterium]|nr:DUF1801 domain-containing protein [Anaerolineae bacterium]
MKPYRMRPIREIETYLQFCPPALQDIVYELRSLIAAVAPDVDEVIENRWIAYYYRDRGGPVSAGVCQVSVEADHIRLALLHGAFLPDPEGLLEGNQKAKRYVRLYSFEDVPWAALQNLIAASARFDPRSLSQP